MIRQKFSTLTLICCGLAVILLMSNAVLAAPPRHAAPAGTRSSAGPDLSPAKGDAVLEALLTELDRSKSQLRMDNVPRPYYIEYRVDDIDTFSAAAAFGAMREDQQARFRVLRVVVRVGDYKQDSYYGQGVGQSQILPLDDDPIALRHQIWLTTDSAYKAASEALTQKQALLKQFTPDPNAPDDFARAPAVQAMGPLVKLQYDAGLWRKTLEDVSGLYRQYPDVQDLEAALRFMSVNEYLVNSEGTVTRKGSATYSVNLNGSAQAPDGMRLGRNPYWMVGRPDELPSPEELHKDTVTM